MLVTRVIPSSFASRADIRPGDRLLAVDGQPLRDRLDLAFAESGAGSVLEVAAASGRVRHLKIPRPLSGDLGLELEQTEPQRCDNRCIFCFIHQLPKGMRRSLYVKDEDYRYSFLFGNFITLTNLDPADFERIRSQRLSPLYVSVHATDETLRRRLLGNEAVPELMPQMRRLAGAGIGLHCQIVLCPGINDGPVLESTVRDLSDLGQAVLSIGIVPVGLTAHRKGLPKLEAVDSALAADAVQFTEECQKHFRRSRGRGLVYASDEMFLKAGCSIPPASYYDGFAQKENGIGIARLWLDGCRRSPLGPHAFNGVTGITVVTGTLAAPLVAEGMSYKLRRCTDVAVEICPVPNRFFGETVTVAGLLSGRDILSALSRGVRGEVVCIPPDAVNRDGLLLDDVTLQELARRVGLEVRLGLRGRRAVPGARRRAGAA